MGEEMAAGVRRGGGDTGHGHGLVRGLLAVMVGREGATGGTSLPPTKLVFISDCQTSFNTCHPHKDLIGLLIEIPKEPTTLNDYELLRLSSK